MQLITMAKAAKQIGVSHHTIRKWIQADLIPVWRLPSGRVRIESQDWERFLATISPTIEKAEVCELSEVVKADH
jgi:excisionase family DNA binding protein